MRWVRGADRLCLHLHGVRSASPEENRYGLLAAILCEDIEDDERHAIDRILRSVGSGRLSFA